MTQSPTEVSARLDKLNQDHARELRRGFRSTHIFGQADLREWARLKRRLIIASPSTGVEYEVLPTRPCEHIDVGYAAMMTAVDGKRLNVEDWFEVLLFPQQGMIYLAARH